MDGIADSLSFFRHVSIVFLQLRDKLLTLANPIDGASSTSPNTQSSSSTSSSEPSPNSTRIDVSKWIGKVTLDLIGLAGFDYDFQTLHRPSNELSDAYAKMFSAGQDVNFFVILQEVVPIFKLIPTKRRRTQKEARDTADRVGMRLIAEKKKAVLEAGGTKVGMGKDLLSMISKWLILVGGYAF